MSDTEELLSNLKKAKANLAAAKEQNENAERKYNDSYTELETAKETYRKALIAIEHAA